MRSALSGIGLNQKLLEVRLPVTSSGPACSTTTCGISVWLLSGVNHDSPVRREARTAHVGRHTVGCSNAFRVTFDPPSAVTYAPTAPTDPENVNPTGPLLEATALTKR